MGNVNCNPACGGATRPGIDCFQSTTTQAKPSVRSLIEVQAEIQQIQSQIASAFQEDSDSNFYVLKLSRPCLVQLFKRENRKKSQQLTETELGAKSRANLLEESTQQMRQHEKIDSEIKLIARSPESVKTQTDEMELNWRLKDLLAHLNTHTRYPSIFVPIAMQGEPVIETETNREIKVRGVAQMKALYEMELMNQRVMLYLADSSVLRRFDFQHPESIRHSSFSLEKIQVSRGGSLEFKARQLLNQIREFYHQHNMLIAGAFQESEGEYLLMFVQAHKSEHRPRQQYWPNMFCGELISSLSQLPVLMQRETYKDNYILQCIIRIQSYVLINKEQRGKAAAAGIPELTKQVQYLIVFKEILFLPRRIEFVMQLQKDVTLQLSKVNDKQMIHLVHSLSPKSFLFIVTRRKLPYGQQYIRMKVKETSEKLKAQEKSYQEKKRKKGRETKGLSPIEDQDEELSVSDLKHSKSQSLNHSH